MFSVPKPNIPIAFKTVECDWVPVTILILGEFRSPFSFISQSFLFKILYRAAAKPHRLAVEVPLTNPAAVFCGKLNKSLNHFSTTDSSLLPIGDRTFIAGA